MGLNVNTTLYSMQGVDVSSVNSVANRILAQSANQAKAEPVVKGIDYTKFNRNTLGVNLYSSRTNVDLQKQISQIQAGLYAKSVDVSRLNSAAAQNLYSAASVQKNVELTQSIQQTELTSPKQLDEQQINIIELFNISDKNSSSSGFNPFEEKEQEKEHTN